MSAECSTCGADLVYPEGSWPIGECPRCSRDDEIARLKAALVVAEARAARAEEERAEARRLSVLAQDRLVPDLRAAEARAAKAIGGLKEARKALGGYQPEAWKGIREANGVIDAVLADLAAEDAPRCYCGSLDWTVEHYGRLTHKHGCPVRTDSFCQSHREGCPDLAVEDDEQNAPMRDPRSAREQVRDAESAGGGDG